MPKKASREPQIAPQDQSDAPAEVNERSRYWRVQNRASALVKSRSWKIDRPNSCSRLSKIKVFENQDTIIAFLLCKMKVFEDTGPFGHLFKIQDLEQFSPVEKDDSLVEKVPYRENQMVLECFQGALLWNIRGWSGGSHLECTTER